ncbi:hypothetical protein DRW07_11650 [Alteromonas sediminis]|uniref:DUF2968 domain-containing protein n=1 Tax=Alteromonas sediminis TaxID=2259342 RepID=A0A3N5Y191_9ALTE|nr:hypothetical protein [Alteromonas sediminis]RPJ66723.1 hypothetical protein DRW07_11650 [Alteromonas sediminis]
MKKLLSALSMSFVMGTASAATDPAELKKELEIMTSVINTAIQQQDRRSPISIRSTQATYLANQGVVFTFSAKGSPRQLFIDIAGLSEAFPHDAPLPPISMSATEGDVSFEFSTDWTEISGEAHERVREALEETAEKLRDLRSRERDMSWQEREVEREVRELEFQMRTLKDQAKEEVKKELEKVREKEKSLAKQRVEVREYLAKVENEQKKKREERIAAREKLTNQFLSDFEARIGDVLCRFGSGLRALDEDENVTFILSDIKTGEEGKLDRIYVFSQKQITRCVQSKIDQNELLSAAVIYEF